MENYIVSLSHCLFFCQLIRKFCFKVHMDTITFMIFFSFIYLILIIIIIIFLSIFFSCYLALVKKTKTNDIKSNVQKRTIYDYRSMNTINMFPMKKIYLRRAK